MSNATAPAATAVSGKYLTIVLANEAYGIPVLKVREIIRLQKLTTVPRMPDYLRGVLNLRGRVIPVVDLRIKFGLASEVTERTCVVVVHVRLPVGQTVPMGLIVDAVEEVVTLAADQIEPVPEFGMSVDTEYLCGVAKLKNAVTMLLDLDRILTKGQRDAVEAATGPTS